MGPMRRSKISPQKKPRRRYSQATKRDMILKLRTSSTRDLAADTGIPKSNLSRWRQQTTMIHSFDGNKKRFNLDGAGRPEELPGSASLEAYMTKLRGEERAVTCTHLINFLKRNHRDWLYQYLAASASSYKSLLKLLQRFCARHGFTRKKPAKTKLTQGDLAEIRRHVINVDETGMHYDMPPHAIWAVRGGSSKISSGDKHSYRMTAVLSVRANGEKLPLLFILRGIPGGLIEQGEFDDFPIGHFYAVQEKAWMDARVWALYLRQLLKPQVREPSVLLLENFDPHVSKEGLKIASEECCCVVAAIPPNTTSVVQPLDVGIMAPFKRHLRNLWLEEELIEGDDSEVDVDLNHSYGATKASCLIHRAIKAWARIAPEKIRRNFTKAIPQ
ncbi:hypothetical protein DYB30_012031 [Aphanomyces astaci]|uniref:DDE-1 domain-containing protein n=1 Tax=Aphanomyces astaci TaxID=112090 RepID=A0A397CQD6_APHAT|nr:hypothetical protein DYB30_012031 [Aphanomyces astaci]